MRKKLTALVMASAFVAGTAAAAPSETQTQMGGQSAWGTSKKVSWGYSEQSSWGFTQQVAFNDAGNRGQGSIYMGTGSQGKGMGWLYGIGVGHGKGPASPH